MCPPLLLDNVKKDAPQTGSYKTQGNTQNKKEKNMADKKNVLFVVGTLRKDGFNLQLAKRAEQLLAAAPNVSWLDYSQLPLGEPGPGDRAGGRSQGAPGSARRGRRLVLLAPVQRVFPGHVKNLVDWLPRPPAARRGRDTAVAGGMKATVSGAGADAPPPHRCAPRSTRCSSLWARASCAGETGVALSGASWGSSRPPSSPRTTRPRSPQARRVPRVHRVARLQQDPQHDERDARHQHGGVAPVP